MLLKNLLVFYNRYLLSLIISITVLVSSCQEQPTKASPPTTAPTTPISTPKKTSLFRKKRSPKSQGSAEWAAFKATYQDTWKEQPTTFPYSQGAFFKVYHLNCSGECQEAVFRTRRDYGIEIPKQDFLDLMAILKAPRSYNNGMAACFDPKFGLVVYDKDSIPTEFLSICLDCNNIRSYPGSLGVQYTNDALQGFSIKARTQLRTLFFKWGIDYYGYDQHLDDQAAFLEYLDKKE